MATIRDYGGTTDPLGSPPLGGPGGWCEAVADKFDEVGADGWVTAARLAADSVTAAKIAADAVGASELADGAVDAAALADGSVTPAKLSRPIGNLLTDNQAAGGRPLGTTDGFAAYRCTLAYAGAIVATKDGSEQAAISVDPTTMQDAWMPHTFLLAGELRTATSVAPYVWFYDGGGAPVGDPIALSGAITTTTFLVQATIVPPAGAVAAEPAVYADGPWAAQWAVTAAGIWRGAGGRWGLPGTPIAHLGIRPNPANTAQVQVWNDATNTWVTV